MSKPHDTSSKGSGSAWSFHGVSCTQAEAMTWRNSLNQGYCPWCEKHLGTNRYNNHNKHLRACPKKEAMLGLVRAQTGRPPNEQEGR